MRTRRGGAPRTAKPPPPALHPALLSPARPRRKASDPPVSRLWEGARAAMAVAAKAPEARVHAARFFTKHAHAASTHRRPGPGVLQPPGALPASLFDFVLSGEWLGRALEEDLDEGDGKGWRSERGPTPALVDLRCAGPPTLLPPFWRPAGGGGAGSSSAAGAEPSFPPLELRAGDMQLTLWLRSHGIAFLLRRPEGAPPPSVGPAAAPLMSLDEHDALRPPMKHDWSDGNGDFRMPPEPEARQASRADEAEEGPGELTETSEGEAAGGKGASENEAEEDEAEEDE